MRVHPKKQWAINLVLLSVEANRLTDREDMPLVECFFE
jgi:hypothetical protein